jgi:predicted dehydrogenase
MQNSRTVRVGVIGTGWAERVQIPMFRLGGLTVQAICSGNPDNAQRVAHNLNIPDVYPNWQAMLASDTVNLVSIVTPPHLHCEIAVAALQAGKHVICEKPTALNVAEAEAMLAAAQAAPGQMAILDHELRFHPTRLHLRRLLKDGYVGSVLLANISVLNGNRLNPDLPWNWWSDAEKGGGMLGAVGSHMLDQCRWLVGRVDTLSAQLQTGHFYRKDAATGLQRQVTADDHAQIMLRFANGAQGWITVSGLTPGQAGSKLMIVGTQGALKLDSKDQLWGAQGSDFHKGNWQPIQIEPLAPALADQPQLTAFAIGSYYLALALAQALPQGEYVLPDAASFYDGLAVQRALNAARESYAQKSWVRL